MDVAAFKVLNRGLPRASMKVGQHFTIRKSITMVVVQRASLRVTASLIVPSEITLSLINP